IESNLGYVYLLDLEWVNAKTHLDLGRQLTPTWENTSELAEWSRYAGKLPDARKLDQEALVRIQNATDDDRYLGDYIAWNLMPRCKGDNDNLKRHVFTESRKQKLAFTHYSLSLDMAMEQDFSGAQRERSEALRIDSEREYSDY